ncbi:zinc-dependent peptidase [Escherichia coli]|uniref:zinc-dependent peptidase n=1 Tax=Escherichia coli TaxID=562 RepID=UPI003B28DA44
MPNVFYSKSGLFLYRACELDSLRSCRIALLFCLPVLELGLEWLDGFHEVLIYPAPFVVDDEWEDDIGLVHNQTYCSVRSELAARAYRFELVGYTRFF